MPDTPLHLRLPHGQHIARLLRLFAHRQLAEVLDRVRRGSRRIDLYHWQAPLVEALFPHVLQLYHEGAKRTMRRITSRVATQRQAKAFTDCGRAWYVVKAEGNGKPLFRRVLDLFGAQVIDKVRAHTMAFVQRVLQGITGKVNKILSEADEGPATLPMVGQDIAGVILNSSKQRGAASDLAVGTHHLGVLAAAEQSGVVEETQWLALDDKKTCPVCKLLDGEVRALGEPYIILGGERIFAAPAHNGCRCNTDIVIDGALLAA